MSNSLKLQITIDANGNIKGKLAETSAEMGKLSSKVKDSTTAFQQLDGAMASIAHWTASIGVLSSAFSALPDKLIESVSTMEQLNMRLNNGSASLAEYVHNKQYLVTTADQLSVNIAGLADGFVRMQQVQASGVVTSEQSKAILEGLSQASAASGASAENFKQIMYGLGQALSSGTVHAEELNQVTEPLPGLLDKMGQAAGMTGGQFRKMVNDGKISSDLFAQTLIPALQSYGNVAEERLNTIAGATTNLENAWLKAGDRLEQPINAVVATTLNTIAEAIDGGSESLAQLINEWNKLESALMASGATAALLVIAGNVVAITTATRAAITVTYAYIAANALLARSAGATAVAVTGLNAALTLVAKNPIGLALTVLAAGYTAYTLTADDATQATNDFGQSQANTQTQVQQLLDQEKAFGSTLVDVTAKVNGHGESLDSLQQKYSNIKKPLDEWDKAIALVAKEFEKLNDQAANDLANPTDDAFKAKLAARTKAIADAKESTKRASEEAKRALDNWFDNGFSGAEKASQKLSEFHTKLESDLQRIRYEIDPTLEAFDQYNSKLNTLALAMQTGKITADEYHQAIYQLDSKQFDSPLSGMKDKGLDDLRELKQAIDGWGKDSARAMADFALSGKASFSDFANSVIKDILTMIIYENMTKTLTKGVGSLVNMGISYFTGNSLAGSNVSTDASFVGPVKPFAKGGAFTGFQAFANGGTFTNSIVNSPTAFKFANGGGFNLGVMGEAGPEAVMPLTRIGGKLGVLAQGVGGGSASTNVVINVSNTAGDAVQAKASQSTNSNGDTVIDVVIERVKGALMQDVGNNGSFSQAFSGAYGLSRRAF